MNFEEFMKFIDANIILRYLVKDDPIKTKDCFTFFQRVKQGKEQITTSEAIIAEVVYVLSSLKVYNLTHEEVRDRLLPILSLKSFIIPQKRLYLRALDLYVIYVSLDFEDVLSIAHMEKLKISQIISYDKDFNRIPTIIRREP